LLLREAKSPIGGVFLTVFSFLHPKLPTGKCCCVLCAVMSGSNPVRMSVVHLVRVESIRSLTS